jgi:hypothetical protein
MLELNKIPNDKIYINNENLKNIHYKRSYLVSKADLSKDLEKKRDIDEAFSDPNKYLDMNENQMIIGK